VFDKARENVGERAAGFTGGDQVHVNRGKDPREIAERLREAAAIDERLVKGVSHLLETRLLEAFLEDGQTFVERHARFEEMPKLFRENQQLAVRNF
jgi:hypothetical protein